MENINLKFYAHGDQNKDVLTITKTGDVRATGDICNGNGNCLSGVGASNSCDWEGDRSMDGAFSPGILGYLTAEACGFQCYCGDAQTYSTLDLTIKCSAGKIISIGAKSRDYTYCNGGCICSPGP